MQQEKGGYACSRNKKVTACSRNKGVTACPTKRRKTKERLRLWHCLLTTGVRGLGAEAIVIKTIMCTEKTLRKKIFRT